MKSITVLIIFASFASMAQFTEQNPIDDAANGFESFACDINGDGFNDFVYINEGGIQWRDNTGGEGTFHTIHEVHKLAGGELAEIVISIAPDDIDSDGDIDIAFATHGGDGVGVAWLENLGSGHFAEYDLIIPGVTLRRIYFEDVDNDSDPDLIVNVVGGDDTYDDHLLVLENTGGDFEAPLSIAVYPDMEKASNFGDLDGDGDLDAIVGIHDLNEIHWYENMGGMSFAPGIIIEASVENVGEIHSTDFDEDGDLDVIYTASNENHLSWIENTGAGTFGDSEIIHTCNRPTVFRLSDLDDDGDEDLILIWHEDFITSTVSLFEKTGPVTFAPEIVLLEGINQMYSVSFGDLNMDGAPDILSRSPVYGQYTYLANVGGLTFADPTLVAGFNMSVQQLIHADLNGDGILDIITYNLYPKNISWYQSMGDGTFGPHNLIASEVSGLRTINVLDLDNDFDNDILLSSLEEEWIASIENLGGGSFGPIEMIDADVANSWRLQPIDFDNDGDSDFILIRFSEAPLINLYENTGGTFEPPIEIPTDASYVKISKTLDLDSDGDDDFIMSDGANFLWFENTGGAFAPEVILASYPCADFEIADLNNDGNLDLVGVNGYYWDPELYWIENLGDFIFDEETIISANYFDYRHVKTADFDGNGTTDILIGGYFLDEDGMVELEETGHLSWLQNMGDAEFGLPLDISTDFMGLTNMHIADIDNDEDADIFAVSDYESEISWFKNPFNSTQQVGGMLYFDENENGLRDLGEEGLAGIQIESDPSGGFAYTFEDGTYILNFDEAADGDYLIFPEELEHWSITSDPTEYPITVDDGFDGAEGFDFGFYPVDDETEVVGTAIGGLPRCNTLVNYYISYENIGGTIANGIIELELDENITYIDAEILPDSVVDNTCYWSFEELFYFDDQLIPLHVEMPSAEFIGETLTSYVTITALDDVGAALFVHEDSLEQVLICAYDPNDKTVFPKGTGEFGNIPPTTPYLEYTVRFQNTGTDTAFNIVIKDQLSEYLDWSSLQILGKSHDMSTYIEPSGEAAFTFNDIMLPDSNVNELASHGFVKYRIDLWPDPSLGTVITNTAHIYFDLNPAIVTNTTINTIFDGDIDDSSIPENETSALLVYPNPFNETTTIYFGKVLGEKRTIRVFNMMGNLVYEQSNITDSKHQFSAAQLGKGIYILTVEGDQPNTTVQIARLIIQ